MEVQVLLRMLLTAWVSRTPWQIEGGAGGHETDERVQRVPIESSHCCVIFGHKDVI